MLKSRIGADLRKMREEAGISRAEVAARFMKAAAWPGHIETGLYQPSVGDMAMMLEWYGHPERTDFYTKLLARAKRGKDWWSSELFVDAAPGWFNFYLGLESIAEGLDGYDAMVPPGLLQTEDTARAIIRGARPDLSDQEIRRRAALRVARQDALRHREDGDPLRLNRVIDEFALRRPIGDPGVHRAQLLRLAEAAEQMPNVELQVLPVSVGAHPSIEGTFTVLAFPPEYVDDTGMVYVENREDGIYYKLEQQVQGFKDDLKILRTLALKPDKSISFIRTLAKEIHP
ncbi:Scr1 family TA system antitoxin-like transcriptional regulator [Amycolatopsis sp. NPDC058986]|uniref:helix-turn-helix domain-containing protein n=1 Tax=Amycolatopsis sp. NPDC058986 TaxID=3346685 RepID=UPI00366DD7C1